MLDIDLLIDDAVMHGEFAAGGVNRDWLARNGNTRMAIVMSGKQQDSGRLTWWTAEEDQFVRDNILTMTDEQIGQALGRSKEAVHIRRERQLRLPARTLTEQWPTMRAAARMLGIPCAKSLRRLIDDGVLPGYSLPMERDTYCVIPKPALIRFAVNPMNWIYFKPERVADPRIKRFVDLRRQRWNDAWWTTGQVAAYHGVSISLIHKLATNGTIPARRWANWQILRSDGVRLRLNSGKGSGGETWTLEQDRFVVMARAVGLSYTTIERTAKLRHVAARIGTLHQRGDLVSIAKRVGVQCNGVKLHADFRHHPKCFSMLWQATKRLRDDEDLSDQDINNLLGVFASWMDWHAADDGQRELARKLATRSQRSQDSVKRVYRQLIDLGFNKF